MPKEPDKEVEDALDTLPEDTPVFVKGSYNPSKFTKNNIAIILKNLKTGMPLNLAISRAKITKATYDSWCEKCRAGNKRFANFTEIMELAINQGQADKWDQLMILAQNDGKLLFELFKMMNPNMLPKNLVTNLNQTAIRIEYVDVGDRAKTV